MPAVFRRLVERLTYANVVATIALFAALGTGGAYAAERLARNSVGSAQLKKNAVTSRAVKDGSLAAGDLSKRARQRLSGAAGPIGPQGPAGVNLFAVVAAGGGFASPGTAGNVTLEGNVYRVTFGQPVKNCAYAANLSAIDAGGGPVEPPAGGTATVGDDGGNTVIVKTYDAAGNPTPAGFRLIIAC